MQPALESVPGTDAEERQTRAITELLKTAYDARQFQKAVKTRREAEEQRAYFLAKQEELQVDAKAWHQARPDKADPDGVCRNQNFDHRWKRVTGLIEGADGRVWFSVEPDKAEPDWRNQNLDHCSKRLMDASNKTYAAEMRFAVERPRGDRYARWLAVIIANRARALFGSPLYGVTAALVSMAKGITIDWSDVRNWCRSPAAP
jgi:hypothetical protein